jgi:DNA-binding transcriptional regulator YiaG
MKEQRKNLNKIEVLYLKENRIEVLLYSDEYAIRILEGWSTKQTPEHKSMVVINSNKNRKILPKSEKKSSNKPRCRIRPLFCCLLCRDIVSINGHDSHFLSKKCERQKLRMLSDRPHRGRANSRWRNLKELRKKIKMTQFELADATEVNISVVRASEQNQPVMEKSTKKMFDFLQKKIPDLIFEDEIEILWYVKPPIPHI